MKKILFVINTMGRAGAEKSMVELMKVIDTNLYEMHLLVLVNRGEMYDEVPRYVKIRNKKQDNGSVLSIGARFVLIKTVLVAMVKRMNLFREIPYLYRNLKEQRRYGRVQLDKLFWKLISDAAPVINEKYDLAISYLEGGAAYYVADHVNADKKAAFIHIDLKKAGYTPFMDHGCYDKMNRIFCVSEDARKSFLNMYPQLEDRTHIFYNIINKKEIKILAEESDGFQDDFEGIRLLTIGRLHYQKAYDVAIPVLAKLKADGYKLRWYVLGDGGIRNGLEKLIEQYGLTGEFVLLGAVPNPYPYLKQCDLYVHATRFEGKSIAIEEAQVLGKAIVASDCTGNREQITNGKNGFIVDLAVEDIAVGIKELIGNQMVKKQFEEANERMKFDYDNNLKLLYDFIEGNCELS